VHGISNYFLLELEYFLADQIDIIVRITRCDTWAKAIFTSPMGTEATPTVLNVCMPDRK
jgi:hypothetical protein